MNLRKAVCFLLSTVLLLGGCAAAQPETPEQKIRNQLTVYVSHKKSVYQPILREFEDRTGIWVNVVSGGTNELLEQIRGEQAAPAADVMFGGGVESLKAYGDCFSPYVSRETGSISQEYLDNESLFTPFSALPSVLIYNTKLVDTGALEGWKDLLQPEFRGKIAFADPEVSGSSYTALITALMALEGSVPDPMKAFVSALDGALLSGSGEVVKAVSEGRAFVGITLEETAEKAIAAGDHIAIVYPKEGTSCLPDGAALIKNAPHPDNARLFLDFVSGKDVQTFLTSQECRRSVRTDVPASPGLPELSALRILLYDADRACQEREEMLNSWKENREAAK